MIFRYGIGNTFAIPPEYTASGNGVPNCDLIIFITGRPTHTGVLAWAGELMKDTYNRPICGHFNWGPNQLSSNTTHQEMQLGVAMHEMTHVLGFSSSKYGEYRNWDILHTPRPSAMVYRTVTRTNPVNQQLYNVDEIILPSVLSKARDQFSCFNNQLTGVQLEDGGGSGTARSHWERRLFKDDYMAGSVPQRPVFSAVSLALLEDTGFYKADYGKAETMGWGNGAGCTFFNGACSEWTLEGYTCSEEGETSCSFDLRDKAVCSVTTFNSALPRKYQHFTTTTKGGSDELADYCPL
eukprot:TRINITY_DN1028_c0_g1_i4.p1 TRINITY_DN1028_c0_g1~~TRINITY_DN1028_c0_g1_i4.p1  ORF type:complete len:295 (+),score=58.79 TRINITY_DN1028_c0_g1_i4:899-1783(+)